MAHPYKTVVLNGVYVASKSQNFNNRNITPRDDFHVFTVKDPNDDNEYAFLVDGEQLGTLEHASIPANLAGCRYAVRT